MTVIASGTKTLLLPSGRGNAFEYERKPRKGEMNGSRHSYGTVQFDCRMKSQQRFVAGKLRETTSLSFPCPSNISPPFARRGGGESEKINQRASLRAVALATTKESRTERGVQLSYLGFVARGLRQENRNDLRASGPSFRHSAAIIIAMGSARRGARQGKVRRL